MKKIIAAIAVVALASSAAMASTGWLDSYARMWNGAADTYYYLNNDFAGTPDTIDTGATVVGNFNTADLGTFSTGYSLFLNAEISGWADAGDAFSTFRLHYRVDGGTWVTDPVDSVANIGGNNWRGEAQGNDLSGLAEGTHTVELYLSRTHTWAGGSFTAYMNTLGDNIDGIGGAVDPNSVPPTSDFFGATFTVVPEPATLALFGMGMVGLAVARRRRA